MDKTCECGRVLCDLCKENRAAVKMKNTKNANILNCCVKCWNEIWGDDQRAN